MARTYLTSSDGHLLIVYVCPKCGWGKFEMDALGSSKCVRCGYRTANWTHDLDDLPITLQRSDVHEMVSLERTEPYECAYGCGRRYPPTVDGARWLAEHEATHEESLGKL